uniref:G_PROTEIN_RECEP_F1_2 domain-containing protein n=1 Tax=Macrostomum lignano TaxID=282301 RepID=A0A1I8GC81_9PLAT
MDPEQLANLTQCDSLERPVLFTTVVPILFSIVVLLGLLGNALVIAVVAANSNMRSTTNILITSLAVADLLFITLCVPFTALFYVFSWVFGHAACVLFQYFTYVPVYCSVYTLVLMSADRYLAVVHPIRSMAWRTERNTLAAVAITWLGVALAHLPLAMEAAVVPVQRCRYGNCSVDDCGFREMSVCIGRRFFTDPASGEFGPLGRVFYTTFNIFGYALPFAVIITLYVLLVKRLMFGRSSAVAQSSEAARSKRRVTRTVVTVVAIFGTCWLPIHAIFALQNWHRDLHYSWFRYLQVASQVLAYMNSCMNPIVYAFVSDNYRQAFASFLGIQLAQRTRRGTNAGRSVVQNTAKNSADQAVSKRASGNGNAAAATQSPVVGSDDDDNEKEECAAVVGAAAARGRCESVELVPLNN